MAHQKKSLPDNTRICTICEEVLDDITACKCLSCGEIICRDCAYQCPECHEFICENCSEDELFECDACEDSYCPECAALNDCGLCGKSLCVYCTTYPNGNEYCICKDCKPEYDMLKNDLERYGVKDFFSIKVMKYIDFMYLNSNKSIDMKKIKEHINAIERILE